MYIFRQKRSSHYVTHRHNFEIQNVLVSKRRMLLSWKVVNRDKFGPLKPDEDKTCGGSLVLDLRI